MSVCTCACVCVSTCVREHDGDSGMTVIDVYQHY